MSLDSAVTGDPIHRPKRRDVFKFDDEVAAIFDNMAPRSIPMYNEVHRMHVSMLRDRFIRGAVITDVGSSTGHLFRNIEKELGQTISEAGLFTYAIDVSEPMMARLHAEFPTVGTIVGDLTELPSRTTRLCLPADIMFCFYTLQFVPPSHKTAALDWLVQNTKVGGLIVLGQKESVPYPEFASMFGEEYYQFRRDNGYSQEEIDAKTAALKGSMFTVPHFSLLQSLADHGVDAIETSRWLEFSTVIGVRRK